MPAPFPTPTNFTAASETLGYFNNITESWFGRIILLAIFVIIFGMSNQLGVKKAFAAAAFPTFILGVILRLFGAIDDFTIFIVLIGTVIGIIALLSDTIQDT